MDPLDHRQPLSEILLEICEDPDPSVSLGEIGRRFGWRAFGALLFFFSAPNWLPLPPGSSTFLAMPLILLGPQMIVGSHAPWLPRWMTGREMRRADVARGLRKLIPTLEKIEHVSRPRMSFMFGAVGDRLIGAVSLALALVLLLPIPLGNMAPAAAIAVLGLSLVQRDGLITLVGYGIAAFSGLLLVVGWTAAAAALNRLLQVFGLA